MVEASTWTPCSAPAAALCPWNRCGAGWKLVEVKEFFRICWDIMGDVHIIWEYVGCICLEYLVDNIIPVGTCKSLLFFFKHFCGSIVLVLMVRIAAPGIPYGRPVVTCGRSASVAASYWRPSTLRWSAMMVTCQPSIHMVSPRCDGYSACRWV